MNKTIDGAILSGEHLVKQIYGQPEPLITNIDWNNFGGWQFDLNLGDEAFVTGSDEPIKLKKNGFLTIRSGCFALLTTNEKINMPSYLMGFIAVRFSYKKLGLINISGFHVDPGYNGKLIFSVYNVGPNDIIMRQGQPVFSIFFQRLSDDLSIDLSSFKDSDLSDLPIHEDIRKKLNEKSEKPFKRPLGFNGIPLDMITSIHGPSKSITMYNDRIEKLEHSLKIYGGIALAILGAIAGVAIGSIIGWI